MNKYICLLILLPLSLSAQTIKDYIINDWPNERYQVHGDGTVTDTQTKLMWMQCSLGQDHESNCSGDAETYDWQEALEAAETYFISIYSDWRLPNIKELDSLVALDRHSPAINSTVFPNTMSERYWSSSPHYDINYNTWEISFEYGEDLGSWYRANSFYIRLVRSVR